MRFAATNLLPLLDQAFDHPSWHGANLTGALRGVSARDAARIIGNRKSIWHQTLHAAYWKQRVINKLTTPQRFPRKGSNWPHPPADPTDAAWRADLALLHAIHQTLRQTIAALPTKSLTPHTLNMIQGAALHDIYHAGQIKLLRRLLDDAPPPAA